MIKISIIKIKIKNYEIFIKSFKNPKWILKEVKTYKILCFLKNYSYKIFIKYFKNPTWIFKEMLFATRFCSCYKPIDFAYLNRGSLLLMFFAAHSCSCYSPLTSANAIHRSRLLMLFSARFCSCYLPLSFAFVNRRSFGSKLILPDYKITIVFQKKNI